MCDERGRRASVAAVREQVASLRRERAELEGLAAEMRRGQAQFQQQVERTRAIARRVRELPHSGIARSFGSTFQTLTGSPFQEGARSGFVGALREVEHAIDEVNREISSAQARADEEERALALLGARGRG